MCVRCKSMTDPIVLRYVPGTNLVIPPVPDRQVVRCTECEVEFYLVVEDGD